MKKYLVLILVTFLSVSPLFSQKSSETNFELITENRELPPFDGIQVTGRFKIILSQDNAQQVSATVPDKFLETVETKVENGILHINMVDLKKEKEAGILESLKTKYNDYLLRQPIEIKIRAVNLKSISAKGASRIESQGTLHANKLTVELLGASKAELNINASAVDAVLAEAAKIQIKGNASQVFVKATGASTFNGASLLGKEAKVDLAGASRSEVHATESLDANLSGATKLICTGSPKKIKQYASRGSSITVK